VNVTWVFGISECRKKHTEADVSLWKATDGTPPDRKKKRFLAEEDKKGRDCNGGNLNFEPLKMARVKKGSIKRRKRE